jgi:dTDP-alpha-D-glucuronic acid decarboxylase
MIAVTGAGGFIGSHLVDALLERGDDVLALDLPPTAPGNLRDAASRPGFTYRSVDVTDAAAVRTAFRDGPRAVVHAAATVGVEAYHRAPMETIETSVIGTRNVLRECVSARSHLVYLSSSEVFGRNPEVPWLETSDRVLGDPSLSRWSYSSSKGICEHLVNAARDQFQIPVTIARPFNIYGERQRPAFVVPITVHKVLNGNPPVIFGDGTQTRCFTFQADLVRALLLCLDRPEAKGETFNLGHPRERTVRDAIDLIVRACGSDLVPEHRDPRATFGRGFDEIPRRVPEVSKAARLLGWTARVDLDEGARRTAEWARESPEWLRLPVA